MSVGLRLIALAALTPLGCQKSAPTPAAALGDPAGAIVVKVASPKKQTLHWSIEQPGTVQPYEATPLVAKLAGYVKTIAPDPEQEQKVIDRGSRVKAGQLLATLDIPEMVEEAAEKRALAEQAEAEVQRAKRDLDVADAMVATGESMIVEAKAGIPRAEADIDRWKSELGRIEDLVSRKVIDQQNRDETLRQYRSAQAALQEANARVTSSQATVLQRQAQRNREQAAVVMAEAKVKVAQAESRRLVALLQYTEIRAPFDGIVTARNVDPGHFLQSGAGSQTKALFTVTRLNPVRVFIDVPEVSANKAGRGARATVRVPALNRIYGEDASEGVAVTRTTGIVQPDSRTLRAEIDLINEDEALLPGMYAFVQIRAESAGATVLPIAAIMPADETHYCFLVEDGKAVKYRVRLGRTDGGTIQVLDRRKATVTAGSWEAFTGSEQVVLGSLGALADGIPVQVAKE